MEIKNFFLRQNIRGKMRLKRQQLTPLQKSKASYELINKVMTNIYVKSAITLAIYIPFDGEIDTRPLIRNLWSAGKHIYLPVLHPFTFGYLLFLKYDTSTTLVLNKFKIKEPKLDVTTLLPIEKLDILFIPLVAFDKLGHRLGMGLGFYDRTIKQFSFKTKTRLIGLAYDCQRVKEILPIEIWDVSMREIITPSYNFKY